MAALCVSLGVVCYFDYRRRKIPNPMIVVILTVGVGESILRNGIRGVGEYLFVAIVVLLLLYPLFRLGGLGAGDVKLLSVCAGYFSESKVFYFLFFSLLISAVISVIQVCRERNVLDRASYFCEYVVAVAKSGRWHLYLPQKGERKISGVCMSGPILCSVLLGIGGVY